MFPFIPYILIDILLYTRQYSGQYSGNTTGNKHSQGPTYLKLIRAWETDKKINLKSHEAWDSDKELFYGGWEGLFEEVTSEWTPE